MTLSRRHLVLALPGIAAAKGAAGLRLAVCSETFQGMSFPQACAAASRSGYTGIEVEPAHLGPDPAALTAAERRDARRAMSDAGVAYVGVHSFLKAPAGLHLTTPDTAVRDRSWDYFRRLIDLAADLGDGGVMVLGSAKQRAAANDAVVPEATKRLADGLARVAPAAASRGVTILLEPLAPHLCNVVTTLAEAIEIAKAIDSPGLKSMLDTHNTAGEKQPPAELVRTWLPWIRHVHLNELDGKRPGAGDFDFRSLLRQLHDSKYRGWVSVEVFDFKPDGETVARESAKFIRDLEKSFR